jgi:hypothetical protein
VAARAATTEPGFSVVGDAERRAAARRSSVIPPPPRVEVLKTRWHPASERRLAEVKLPGTSRSITIREGDTVASMSVSSIEPSSVVFDHAGRRVRRRVGE